MVEIGCQRLVANGWTTYSLGSTPSVQALQLHAKDAHCNESRTMNSNTSNSNDNDASWKDTESVDDDYSHESYSDQGIDNILRADGFVPRLLQRYFEVATAAAGLDKEGVQNRSSATCRHGPRHPATCLLDNVFPLYCIVLIHLAPGEGPLVYPRQRLGRCLSGDISRAAMLATSWAADTPPPPAEIIRELQERFGFLLHTSPEALLAEMEGPGRREVGDVTIIASDMLYCMPSPACAVSGTKRRFDQHQHHHQHHHQHDQAAPISTDPGDSNKRQRTAAVAVGSLTGGGADLGALRLAVSSAPPSAVPPAAPAGGREYDSPGSSGSSGPTSTSTCPGSSSSQHSHFNSNIGIITLPTTTTAAAATGSDLLNSSNGSTNSSSSGASSSSSSVSPDHSLSAPPSSTLYAYTLYQPTIEASLPPTYIMNSESSNKIRFDPSALHALLANAAASAH